MQVQKNYIYYVLILILLFHVLISLFHNITLYIDSSNFTLYHAAAAVYFLYTFLWWLVYRKKRWALIVYTLLSISELLIHLYVQHSVIRDAFGDVLFPANFLFVGIVTILYRQIFPLPVYASKN